jgi:hypothetical protein
MQTESFALHRHQSAELSDVLTNLTRLARQRESGFASLLGSFSSSDLWWIGALSGESVGQRLLRLLIDLGLLRAGFGERGLLLAALTFAGFARPSLATALVS